MIANGAKPFTGYAILSVTNHDKGDEVLYPNPGFPIYESLIKAYGVVPIPLPLLESKDYTFDVDYLERKVNERTRLIILNSPHNPTGGTLNKKTLERIAEIINQYDNLWIYSDEINSQMTHDGKFMSITQVPGMQERTITSGWRIEDLRHDRVADRLHVQRDTGTAHIKVDHQHRLVCSSSESICSNGSA